MRWHLLATDKTYLQLKGFEKIPTDKRDTSENPLNMSLDVKMLTCFTLSKIMVTVQIFKSGP